jgi:polyphosphate kinase
VRGFCCLRPSVPGLSENIRVSSVVGRFLEHSRLFCFQHGGSSPAEALFYIGSADWMDRNLSWRVEAVVPIEDRALKLRLWEFLQILLQDRRQTWDLAADGSYVLRQPEDGVEDVGTHERLMRQHEAAQTGALALRAGAAPASSS